MIGLTSEAVCTKYVGSVRNVKSSLPPPTQLGECGYCCLAAVRATLVEVIFWELRQLL